MTNNIDNIVDVDNITQTLLQVDWIQRKDILVQYIKDLLIDETKYYLIPHYFSLFSHCLIDDSIIFLSNLYIQYLYKHNYTIHALFSTQQLQQLQQNNSISLNTDKQLFIIYGNYPHSIETLPTSFSNIIYRHPLYFEHLTSFHTIVHSHPVWTNFDAGCFVLTTPSRLDRYSHILLELCKVQFPLHKITKYIGSSNNYTNNKHHDKYISASINHLDVTSQFINTSCNYCLILEDDFSFIDDTEYIFSILQSFFQNLTLSPLPFYVCFLSYSKWGVIDPFPSSSSESSSPSSPNYDFLGFSKQWCTTSSGYILQKSTASVIKDTHAFSIQKMIEGESPNIYCCDRYWCKFGHENKLIVFKRKLGFQYITHSDIVNNTNINFD